MTALNAQTAGARPEHAGRRTPIIIMVLAVMVMGLALRLQDVSHEVESHHCFRQSHVAANIHDYLRHGFSIPCGSFTLNQTYRIFDLPAYQLTVATVCRLLGTPVVLTARAVNVALFPLLAAVFAVILIELRITGRVVLITLLLFALSPLDAYYSRALIPDRLCIFISLLSLVCFIKWARARGFGPGWYAGTLACGLLALGIKAPIYGPIAFAMPAYILASRRLRFSPKLHIGFASLACILAAGFFAFKLYVNMENTGAFKTPPWEWHWYFGSLQSRLQPGCYFKIASRFAVRVTCCVFFALCPLGIHRLLRDRLDPDTALLIGLAFGSLATVLVFFNVNCIHDYYQLPYVLTVCFFAAYMLDYMYTRCAGSRMKRIFTAAILFAALGGYAAGAVSRDEPDGLVAAGRFIQANTPADACVLYVTGSDIASSACDPAYLYFARRSGVNVSIDESGRAGAGFNSPTGIIERPLPDVLVYCNSVCSRMFVYTPWHLYAPTKNAFSAYGPRLTARNSAGMLLSITTALQHQTHGKAAPQTPEDSAAHIIE